MSSSRFFVSALGLVAAAWGQARGCELCAVYAADHGPEDGIHGWFTGAAEQFTAFGGLQFNGKDTANVVNQTIESSTTQFIMGYSFNERFSLQANIPYIHRSFRRPNGTGIEEGSEAGLGDAILLGKLLLLRKDTAESSFAWSLLGGLKFPTGSTSQLRDETLALSRLVNSDGSTHGSTHGGTVSGVTVASAIHGNDLTLGSGSFDVRVGTSVYYRNQRAFFTGSVQYAINTEGDYGYRFANDLTWDGGPGYYLLSDPSYTLSLEAAISGEHKGADTYREQRVDSTGFTAVYLGPKLNYTWKDRLSAHFGVDFPVIVTNSGLQAVPGARVRAGFTWLLGPSSEPLPPTSHKTQKSLSMEGSVPPIWTPAPESRFYAGVEYLHWWVKDAPLAIPLVTTGPIASTHHGLLGNPMITASDTTILYGAPFGAAKGGDDSQAFQAFSGTRLTFGYAIGRDRRFAIEASGFMLDQQSAGFESRGDSTGNPVLGIPVNNSLAYQIGPMTIPPGEDSLPYSLPDNPLRFRANGIITGGVKIVNDVRLWGAELNGVMSLNRTPTWELSGVVGLRYLDLAESLNLTTQIQGVSGPYAGQYGEAKDRFSTHNRFFGGSLGLRGRYSSGRFSLDMGARVAIGVSQEVEDVAGGYYSQNFSAPYDTGSEGVFAQPANEGRTSSSRFAMVPEVQLKLGYAITPRLRVTLGYDFLYYSNVLRPSEQIDRNVPKGQTFKQASPLISTVTPSRKFETTDFFAHGFSMGMEFRF